MRLPNRCTSPLWITLFALAMLPGCLSTDVTPSKPPAHLPHETDESSSTLTYRLTRYQERWVRGDSVFSLEETYTAGDFRFSLQMDTTARRFIFCGCAASYRGCTMGCDTVAYRRSTDGRYYDDHNHGHTLHAVDDTLLWESDPRDEAGTGRQEITATTTYIRYHGPLPPPHWSSP
jgi:hypothetical protein